MLKHFHDTKFCANKKDFKKSIAFAYSNYLKEIAACCCTWSCCFSPLLMTYVLSYSFFILQFIPIKSKCTFHLLYTPLQPLLCFLSTSMAALLSESESWISIKILRQGRWMKAERAREKTRWQSVQCLSDKMNRVLRQWNITP